MHYSLLFPTCITHQGSPSTTVCSVVWLISPNPHACHSLFLALRQKKINFPVMYSSRATVPRRSERNQKEEPFPWIFPALVNDNGREEPQITPRDKFSHYPFVKQFLSTENTTRRYRNCGRRIYRCDSKQQCSGKQRDVHVVIPISCLPPTEKDLSI